MKLLLDTHIWIWSITQTARLSRKVARELASQRHDRWLSPVSVWEATQLLERGRIKAEGDPGRWLDHLVAAGRLREAPFTHSVALRVGSIHLPHRDPADRLLVATALEYDLTLVTADQRLLDHAQCEVLRER